MRNHFFIVLFILLAASRITAQNITGTVVDTQNESMPGVSVVVKGTSNGTATDIDGKFVLNVTDASDKTLVFSFVGYKTKEQAIGQNTNFSIVLEENTKQLDELVVVGYGTQKKSSLTASIASVGGTEIAAQPVSDISNSLGGRVAGVMFTQTSGQVGNDMSQIYVRGIATNGNSTPLYIVDGIPRNYSQLNPSDIETVSVLKDAAAVAPYGLAGANGVILVTTKSGKIGRPVLSYDGYVGFQNPTVITKFVNSYQYATMKNIATVNSGSSDMPFSDYDLQKFKDGTDPDGHPSLQPIQDMLLRNRVMTGHNLSLSGGTETVKYAMGLGYLDQLGMFQNMQYQRYNLSGNLQVQATKTTTVSLSLNGRVEQRNLTWAGYNYQSIFERLVNAKPMDDPKLYSNGYHPYLYASTFDDPSYIDVSGNVMLTQMSIEQKLPLKGLSVKFVGSFDWNPFDPFNPTNTGISSLTRNWSAPVSYYTLDNKSYPMASDPGPWTYSQYVPTTLPSFSEEYHQTQALTYQAYLNYAGNFGKNAVTGLVVFESRNTKSSMFSASQSGYSIPIAELFAGDNSNIGATGNSQATKQRSLVYRVTYGYDNKYLFEATGRYDGHYYFAPGHRFGFFPAFSVAWRLTQEKFMQDVEWLNDFKLRASYGESGNLAGAPFQYQSGYNLLSTSAVLNGALMQGLSEAQVPNPNITWERAKKTNVGFDMTFLKSRFNVSADYFYEKRDNMLVTPDVTLPAEYGIGLSQVNAGSMENRGVEISASYNYSVSKDLHVGLSGNFTYAKNKLLQVFENPATYDKPGLRQTGRPLNTTFGYKAIGFYTQNDFDANGNLKSDIAQPNWSISGLAPGDIRYADLSGPKGVPDGKIDEYDEIPIGNPGYPGIVYGFTPSISYKGFDLSLLFQGAGIRGVQLTNSAAWAFDNNKNAPITTLDYWTPDNPNASYPRLTSTPTGNNTVPSTFWERSAAYLRLRTGMLGYTIPNNISQKMGMSVLKIYVSGQNLLTWSPIKNFDPEVATNNSTGNTSRGWYFPTQKVISFGLNIQF